MDSRRRKNRKMMRLLRKSTMSMLVWMTAASTLMGSTPHTICRCPDGTLKLFCCGVTSHESPCCCGEKCCSSSKRGEGCCCKLASSAKQTGVKPSCCNKPTAKPAACRTASTASEGLMIGGTCCQMILVQPEAQSLSFRETKPVESSSESPTLFSPAVAGDVVQSAIPEKTGWRADRPPPPTDLITVLKHFTI